MKINFRKFAAGLLAVAALAPGLAMAQEKEGYRLVEPEKVVFNPYWFGQAQVGAGYTINEGNFGDGISPAAAINFGYRPLHWFGFRFGASGWQGKGKVLGPDMKYKFDYVQGNLDAMVSLTNLFCGFNPKRVCDFYLAVGIGGAYGFHNNDAVDYKAQYPLHFQKLWNNRWFLAGRGALGVDFRCSDYVAINVEANGNLLPDSFNSKNGDNSDWQLNLLVGVTWKFGKNYKVIPAVYEELPAPEPVPEPKPEPKPTPKVVKPAPMTQDVFFLINSYKIRPEEQLKVDQLVEYMKANPTTKVTVTGYADKETGTGRYNMALSEKRAKAVATAIEAQGIDAERVIVKYDGDTVQPFPESEYEKNRVAICITKD